jgi:hypothetical protein
LDCVSVMENPGLLFLNKKSKTISLTSISLKFIIGCSKIRERKNYVGDYHQEDMENPILASEYFLKSKSEIESLRKKIESLRKKNYYLKKTTKHNEQPEEEVIFIFHFCRIRIIF